MARQRAIFRMALDLLGSATGPRTTVEAGYRWHRGDDWKRLVFTDERPFLDAEATAKWAERNAEYRRLKSAGKV